MLDLLTPVGPQQLYLLSVQPVISSINLIDDSDFDLFALKTLQLTINDAYQWNDLTFSFPVSIYLFIYCIFLAFWLYW